MAKTLTINFKIEPPELFLKGLSFKALKGTQGEKYIFRDDCNAYAIDTNFRIDGKTSQVEESFLVSILQDIYKKIPFEKIKYKGYYKTSPEELYKKVTLNN